MEQIEQFNMSPGVDFHPVKEYYMGGPYDETVFPT